MTENLVNQLRECAVVKGKQKTWISELSDEQLFELFTRIRNGENSKSIVRNCLRIWGIRNNSTEHSLSQGVQKYKNRVEHIILPCEPTEVSPAAIPPSCSLGSKDLEKVPATSTTSGSLIMNQRLAAQLRKRIETQLNSEESGGIPSPYIHKDVQSLAVLQKAIILQRKALNLSPDEDIEQLVQQKLREKELERDFNAAMASTTKEDRSGVCAFFELFLKEMHKITVTAEVRSLPDGRNEYILPEEAFAKRGSSPKQLGI